MYFVKWSKVHNYATNHFNFIYLIIYILTIFFELIRQIIVSFLIKNHHLDRSTTKPKTFDPVWNEIFMHEVHNARIIGLTVFHDAAIPPDDFVANCTIAFDDLTHRGGEAPDFWVCILLVFDIA